MCALNYILCSPFGAIHNAHLVFTRSTATYIIIINNSNHITQIISHPPAADVALGLLKDSALPFSVENT